MVSPAVQPPAVDGAPRPSAPSRLRHDVPGPQPSPILGWRGNALRFFRNPIAHMLSLRAAHGNVVRLAQGGNPSLLFKSTTPDPATFFAFGPRCNRQILTQLDVFQVRPPRGPGVATYDALSQNVLLINGDRHRQQRKLLMAAFTRERLKAYSREMMRCAEHTFSQWRARTDQVIDLSDELSTLSMNISSRCFYGLDPGRQDEDLARRMRGLINTILSPASMIPLDLPGMPYRRLVRELESIKRQLRREIEKKRAAGADDVDILSMMVRAHEDDPSQITADELLGEAFVMFFAGHDTTSKAMTWALFLLAQHPAAAAELLDELDREVAGDAPTYEQLYELPVLDRVVKECLRILPPAVLFAREAVEATELEDFRIPAGSEVIYSPYMTHVDPEIFPEPHRFAPDRWREIKPGPYEYLPFGVGRRSCLGGAFGALEVRLLLPMILRRFRFEILPGTRVDLKTNVVIGPKNGLPVRLKAQDRRFEHSPAPVEGFIREMVEL